MSLPDAHEAFHVYAAEWTRDRIDILVDDVCYHSFENARTTPDEWPFDQKFHLLLNVTVGGTWGGVKGVDDEVFPCSMDVKYVRGTSRSACWASRRPTSTTTSTTTHPPPTLITCTR